MNNEPSLCAAGCGFFGNPASQNLCSKCHRDFLKQTALPQTDQQATQPGTKNNDNKNNNDVVRVSSSNVVGDNAHQEKNNDNNDKGEDEGMMKKKKNKCGKCNKRVGLTGFECKCGEVYCGTHRYAEAHSCQFDYKGVERQGLSKILFAAAECKADKLENGL